MNKQILVLDAGTSNMKAFLINRLGEVTAKTSRPISYITDSHDQVEQDPLEIKEHALGVIRELLEKNRELIPFIDSMGITAQRSSFLFWNKKTGQPLSRVITWQDKRAANYARKKSNMFLFSALRKICGFLRRIIPHARLTLFSILKFDTVHSSVRTGFLLENDPGLRRLIDKQDSPVLWGTVDSWILWNLSDNDIHATDYSLASSTGLLDPFSLKWNTTVLKLFEIPRHILPELKNTGDDYGTTSLFTGKPIPIRALIGDQQASLFGQGCFKPGDMKCTNGTGSFVDLNTGSKPYASPRQLYPLVAWRYKDKLTYMLEGQSQNTGNIIDWLINELMLIQDPGETETLAFSVKSTEGLYFLPAFSTGLTFPYWDATTRGSIFGLSLKSTRAHIVRGVLEGICFRIADIVQGIQKDTRIPLSHIRIDGGVSSNRFVHQFLSDILGMTVERYLNTEATALGTAFMTGLMNGFWDSEEELLRLKGKAFSLSPEITEDEKKKKYRNWQDVIRRSLKYLID